MSLIQTTKYAVKKLMGFFTHHTHSNSPALRPTLQLAVAEFLLERVYPPAIVKAVVLRLLHTREEKEAFAQALEEGAVLSGNGLGQVMEFLYTGKTEVLRQINDFDLFKGIDYRFRPDWCTEHPYYGTQYHIPEEYQIHMAPPVYTGRVSVVELGVINGWENLARSIQNKLDGLHSLGNWVDFYLSSTNGLVVGEKGRLFQETGKLWFNAFNHYASAGLRRFAKKLKADYQAFAYAIKVDDLQIQELIELGFEPFDFVLYREEMYWTNIPNKEDVDFQTAARVLSDGNGTILDPEWAATRFHINLDRLYIFDNGDSRTVTMEGDSYMPAVPLQYQMEGETFYVVQNVEYQHPVEGPQVWAHAVLLPYEYQGQGLQVTQDLCQEGFVRPWFLPYEWDQGLVVIEEINVYLPDGDCGTYVPAVPASPKELWDVHYYSASPIEVLQAAIPGDELVYGLELETSSLTDKERALVNPGGFIWKYDSSCGYELVSLPLSLEELCERVMQSQLDLMRPDINCGMHVHINRRALSQREVCLLALLLSDDGGVEEIAKMAGRCTNNWCKKVDKKTEADLLATTDRYEAVNLTNYSESKYTVEIRIFAGTNCKETVIKRLQWVNRLVKFVKSNKASASFIDFMNWNG